MPTNPEKWTIFNKNGSPAIGDDLDGLLIKKTTTSYELYGILKKVAKNSLPVTFSNVMVGGVSWDITVDSLPNSADAGSWLTPSAAAVSGNDKDVPPQSGEFTAQSGGEIAPAEKAASSAKAS
jgi:hypothetical protein